MGQSPRADIMALRSRWNLKRSWIFFGHNIIFTLCAMRVAFISHRDLLAIVFLVSHTCALCNVHVRAPPIVPAHWWMMIIGSNWSAIRMKCTVIDLCLSWIIMYRILMFVGRLVWLPGLWCVGSRWFWHGKWFWFQYLMRKWHDGRQRR